MYQIDLCEEVLASAPNNTSLHGINMWKITLCFVELVRFCWGGGGRVKTGFLLLFFINYLLWLKNWKLYPENNASPFIACLSLHSVNRETIATLSSPEVFLVLLTLISSTCVLIGLGSVYQLCSSKEGKEPPSTKRHPLSECRLLCSGPASRLEECLAHQVSALLTPKLSLNFLSHKNRRVCHGVWTRHWQGDEGEAAVDQGQSHNYLAYCVASISIFSCFFLLL